MALIVLSNIIGKSYLLKMGIDYSKLQIDKTFNLFEELFDPILNLEPNDKIGWTTTEPYNETEYIYINGTKFNFKLYLDKYKIYQSVSRWYYGQTRIIVFDKLDILFNEYLNFIYKLKFIDKTNCLNNLNENKEKYTRLNHQLSLKLPILLDTYNDPEVSKKINSYLKKIAKLAKINDQTDNSSDETISIE